MKLDGFGILVKDMAVMVRFYRDVLGFEIKENEKQEILLLFRYQRALRNNPERGKLCGC